MRRLMLPLLLCSALAAGCGSDEEETASPAAPAESAAPSESAEPTESAGTTEVGMKNLQFNPKAITVKVGETITWTNQESIPHNVVNAQDGEQPKSELFGEGGTYEFTPKKPGTINYVCTVHPGMDGTITVE